MTHPIRVVIADDHSIVRKGIQALLAHEHDIEVVGDVGDGAAAVAETIRLKPDVLLIDLVMPVMDGVEAIWRICRDVPTAKILVLTSFVSDDKLFPAIRAGASGYLLKESDPQDLISAIHRIHDGELCVHPSIARKMWQEVAHPSEHTSPLEVLSEREVQILQLAARGWRNSRIADELQISEATVRTHVSHILSKLALDSRTQAVLFALREGLASLSDACC